MYAEGNDFEHWFYLNYPKLYEKYNKQFKKELEELK